MFASHAHAVGSGIVNPATMLKTLYRVPGLLSGSYTGSKHAVVGLSRVLRFEARRYGVRVSAVCPGSVRTPVAKNVGLNDQTDTYSEPYSPLQRCNNMRSISIISLILVITACGHSSGHRVEYFDDEGALGVRTLNAPLHDGHLFTATCDLILGIDEGEPAWQIFGMFIRFTVGKDGRIYIADYPDNFVYIVDPSGELLSRFGGTGSGPGEFREFWQLLWVDDESELWIDDVSGRQVYRFTPDGVYLGRTAYNHPGLTDIYTLTGYDFLGGLSIRNEENESSLLNQYCFLDSTLTRQHDFLTVPGQSFLYVGGRGLAMPFDYYPSLHTFPDGRILIADPIAGRLSVFSATGEPERHIEREWIRPPVTADEIELWREQVRQFGERYQSYAEVSTSKLPDHHGTFSKVLTDDQGRIWICTTPESAGDDRPHNTQWDVFGPDGVWLGSQSFPCDPDLIRGNCVYDRDSGSNEYGLRISRYRLTANF